MVLFFKTCDIKIHLNSWPDYTFYVTTIILIFINIFLCIENARCNKETKTK